jgi:NADH:ubiquinone oxidoreductase subunit B-like Fe-S oxidoreductase
MKTAGAKAKSYSATGKYSMSPVDLLKPGILERLSARQSNVILMEPTISTGSLLQMKQVSEELSKGNVSMLQADVAIFAQ